MLAHLKPGPLTLTRSISTDGQTIIELRTSTPVVGLISAYRCQRHRLAMRFHTIPGFRMLPIPAQDVFLPRHTVTGLPEPTCDVLMVEPGDMAVETLSALIQFARRHDLPLIWLGEPPVAQRLASASIPGGILPPQATTTQMERTLQAAVSGLTVIHPDYAHVVDQTEPDPDPTPLLTTVTTGPSLSPREAEVLTHVASGLPNKAIARELGITGHTVKFHLRSLMTKLNAGSRTEAVAIASRVGLLDG